jgi:signal transduction histidine kinase
MSLAIAASETVDVVTPGQLAGRETLPDSTGLRSKPALEALSTWWRWRGPTLWEFPVALAHSPLARALALVLAFGLMVLKIVTGRRRTTERASAEAWEELLRIIRLTEHGQWRQSLLAAERAGEHARATRERADAVGGAMALARKALPSEMIETLAKAVELARLVKLDGATRAGEAIVRVQELHSGGSPEVDPIVDGICSLRRSLDLVADAVRERYSSDLSETLQRVLTSISTRLPMSRVDVRLQGDDFKGQGRFPMASSDLFIIMEETITNAAKKSPPPSTVQISALRSGRRAVLRVWDDGPALEAEAHRPDRPGSGTGLKRIEHRIASLYSGSLAIEDAPEGGVLVTVAVPDFREA